MGSTHTRVAKVLVTNVQAVNTGTSVTTAVDGDVILFDRAFNAVGTTDTVINDPANDLIYVGLGLASGGMEFSAGIQVRNIKAVRRSAYAAATPYTVTVGAINAVNDTEYDIRIIYRDQHASTPGKNKSKNYYFQSDASATATEIATGLAAKINADKNALVTASVSGADLVLAGKVIAPNAIDTYQRVTFDVALVAGFDTKVATITTTPGSFGQGTGQRVKDLEQATKNDQRILWPIPSETTKASVSGIYNLVTIEHNDEHLGDLQNQYKAPLKTVIAFASASATASAKEAAFMANLSPIVESAGIYVS